MPLALPCSSGSSLVSLSVLIQISRVLSSNSSPGPAPEASSHPPPSDLRQISWLHCQASLPGSDGPLLTIMSLQRSPKVPRFPSLSMVPYWGFYNSLCLLHPCHNHGPHTKGAAVLCVRAQGAGGRESIGQEQVNLSPGWHSGDHLAHRPSPATLAERLSLEAASSDRAEHAWLETKDRKDFRKAKTPHGLKRGLEPRDQR